MMDQTWLWITTPAPSISATDPLFTSSHYHSEVLFNDLELSSPSPSPSSTSSSISSSLTATSASSTSTMAFSYSRPLSSAPTTPISSPEPQTFTAHETTLPSLPTAQQTLSSAQKINLHLLRSCALLACAQPVRALQAADIALKHAQDHGIAYLLSKSHLYRGLALARVGRWKEAEAEFEKSGGLGGWGLDMEALKDSCVIEEDKMREDGEVEPSIEQNDSEEEGQYKVEDLIRIREKDILWGVWPGNDER